MTDADILAYFARGRANCKNAPVNHRLQVLGRALRNMAKFYKAEIPALELKSTETKESREIVRKLSLDEQLRLLPCPMSITR